MPGSQALTWTYLDLPWTAYPAPAYPALAYPALAYPALDLARNQIDWSAYPAPAYPALTRHLPTRHLTSHATKSTAYPAPELIYSRAPAGADR